MESLGLGAGGEPGAGPGVREARPNVLRSIRSYLDTLEDSVQDPPVVLPSLSYPAAQGLYMTLQGVSTESLPFVIVVIALLHFTRPI